MVVGIHSVCFALYSVVKTFGGSAVVLHSCKRYRAVGRRTWCLYHVRVIHAFLFGHGMNVPLHKGRSRALEYGRMMTS